MANQQHTMVNTTFPVFLPEMPELHLPKPEFNAYVQSLSRTKTAGDRTAEDSHAPVASIPIREKVASDDQKPSATADLSVAETGDASKEPSKFMDALLADKKAVPSCDERDGKMLTENTDVAYRTSGDALVDLFFELEDVVSGNRLRDVLEKAWDGDADATLKIIWNARSIHLGKSSRNTFYRAVGWLAEHHPVTLLANLPWLVRPIIQKKAPKPKGEDAEGKTKAEGAEAVKSEAADSDFEMIDEKELDEEESDEKELEGQPKLKKLKLDEDAALTEFDVKYGVAHGYWKDLLNILALAANDELKADSSPRSVLNVERPSEKKKYKRDWTEGRKKAQITERHERVVKKLKEPFYKALHLTVARLFAEQLKIDLARLESGNKVEFKRITLAAKWAPSHKGMHDQHTCIVSTVAELMYPFETVCPEIDASDRALYLKHARQAYQLKTLSPLRKALEIVEHSITAKTFDEIKYERIPSLAMTQYTPLFAKKDFARFDGYIDRVAQGKSKISGATLLPSTLVKAVSGGATSAAKGTNALVEQKLRDMQAKSLDGQWNALVQRIKDSGTLSSSIAVCDVSGSMSGPRFPDGTTPMDSSIGLSLLLAEVTKPPFGGAFITFSAEPQVMRAGGPDDKRSLKQKVAYIQTSDWGMNTDFVAVFERLLLPMAVEAKLKQEDMVKQVFVFSDMQFDSAQHNHWGKGVSRDWSTSYERIQKKFAAAGYLMPKLIFWNLAGGRAGYDSDDDGGDDAAPKPVTASEEGTALVSGYSQGQLKMFLDNGQFDDAEDEVVTEEGEDDSVTVKKQKPKDDPLATVRKAISHEAYRMLRVVD
ncbi:hypothetical protein LTR36_008822 [Oleoguttula mirabilis]|uniref:Uncharacterized protein n=1 Tax=Oleoguttula mirabilis TaxID=1507867 RepID=A0AAV9J7T7_9PEZI|nr:hypothetical protein LTR36_008822 [Oleoguttula mirabilis]